MKSFEFYDLKNEKPTRKGQLIERSKHSLPDSGEKVNIRDIITLISLAGIVWFFCYLDNNVMVGLIGTIASTAVLCLTGGDGSALD